jgi:Na+-translocating ferredoxin:NAD+ oxidoreductase RnfD subunit
MPARKYLALALMIGMLLGYGWQSVATSIVLRGIYLLLKKIVHFFQWVVEKLKKTIGFN